MWASVYYDHLGLGLHTNAISYRCLCYIQAEQATMTILVTMNTHAHVIITLFVVACIVIANWTITR